MATTPENRLLRPLLVLLIAAGGVFGLAPFLIPSQSADVGGYAGQDVFLYRLAGASTFGYAVSLSVGFRSRWPALRIPFAAVAVFNAGSVLACLIAIVGGDAELVTYLILPAALLFTAGSLYFLRNPPAGGEPAGGTRDDLAGWFVAALVVSTVAAAVFGLGGLFGGGAAARAAGYGGADDLVYRLGGGATLGYALAGVLMLRSRRWYELRLAVLMGLVFNGLSLVAAVLELAGGGQPIAWLIFAATVVITPLTAVAYRRQGR